MIQDSDINFRTLAYEINDGIYVSNPEGTFIYANLALADIFGFERPADLIGKKFFDFLPDESEQVFMNKFRKSIVPGSDPIVITTEIVKSDGGTALIEVKPMPFIKNQKLLGSQGVVYDITERKQAEKEMMFDITHDSLTGIYNRTFFEAEINRLERGRQFPISIIVVYVGLQQESSDSKDNRGQTKLIRRVAHRLFHSLRGDDIVARIGDEEFAVLFPSVDEHTVDDIIKRIRDSLQEINKDEGEPTLAFYIGAGTAKSGEGLNSVLKRAEAIANLEKKKHNTA